MANIHTEKKTFLQSGSNAIAVTALIVAIVFFLLWFLWPQAAASKKSLGQCLAERGVTMYGVDTCSNCLAQKEMFGKDFSNVPYVNCSFQQDLCRERGIRFYPVWSKGNEALIGTQSLQSLADFSGCPLAE